MIKGPFHWKFSRFAATAAMIMACALPCEVAQAEDEVVMLAGPDVEVDFPRIASERFVTALAWVEKQPAGLQWVRLVVLKDGVLPSGKFFPAARVVSPLEAGANSDPAVAIDPVSSQPSVVWLHSDAGVNALQFNDKGRTIETITTSPNLLDPPSLAFTAKGEAYVAWSEITGSKSRLFVASRGADGWVKESVSSDERPYDVMPQIVVTDSGAELYWYSIQGGSPSSLAAVLTDGALGPTEPFGLGAVPANRLPILYRVKPGSRVGAYWVEQRPEGDVYLNLDPRDDEGAGPQVVGGGTNHTEQLSFSSDGSGVTTWVDGVDGEEKFLSVVSRERGQFVKPVSAEAREPMSSSSANWIHTIWVDHHSPEGKGNLWYWRTR